jgi:hypothetical protein
MVILAVESTGKAFTSGDLINRAFYHPARFPWAGGGQLRLNLLKKLHLGIVEG